MPRRIFPAYAGSTTSTMPVRAFRRTSMRRKRDMESSVFAVTLAGVQALDHSTAWHHYDQSFVGRNYFRVQIRPVAATPQSRPWRQHGTSVFARHQVGFRAIDAGQDPRHVDRLSLRNQFPAGPFSFGQYIRNRNRRPMRYAEVPLAVQTGRVVSVDALRGFNIFWILGADGAIWALDRMLRDKGPELSAIGRFLKAQMVMRSGKVSAFMISFFHYSFSLLACR